MSARGVVRLPILILDRLSSQSEMCPIRWRTLAVLAALVTTSRPSLAADPPANTEASVAVSGSDVPASASPSWFESPKNVGLGLGVVGVVGVGVGSVFGLLSVSTWSKVTSACGSGGPSACVTKNPGAATSDHDTAQTEAAVSTVAFIVGGVFLAAGAAVLLTGVHHGNGDPSVALAPAMGPGEAGLALHGAF
jgi:hypothetical protein